MRWTRTPGLRLGGCPFMFRIAAASAPLNGRWAPPWYCSEFARGISPSTSLTTWSVAAVSLEAPQKQRASCPPPGAAAVPAQQAAAAAAAAAAVRLLPRGRAAADALAADLASIVPVHGAAHWPAAAASCDAIARQI
eukprot:SAG22_NODE_569_length_9023_cov_14.241820_4_plen_137_part_00